MGVLVGEEVDGLEGLLNRFFNANQVTDIEAGDEFLGQFGREWVVWGEGGVEGFDGIEDLEG
jgi:hypothetical protein